MRSSLHALVLLLPTASLHAQNAVFQWADGVSNIETPGLIAGVNNISVASDGTAYIVGSTQGPRTILGDTMVADANVARFDQQGELLWARSPGGLDVAAASGNAVYVVGSFTGTIAFGAATLTANGKDGYLAKYGATGNLLWVHQIGGPGLNNAYSVAVDGLGMVHVVGHFQGSANFGSTTLIATHDTTGYVATFDANGVDQWAKVCGGLDATPDYLAAHMAVEADAAGNTFVCGVFDGTGTFGSTDLAATDFDDIFLARFDASGACTWAQKMGSQQGNVVVDIGITPSSNVFVYGNYYGAPATFCGPALPNSNFGNSEIFLALYNSSGTCQWAQRVAPGFFNDFPANMDVDDQGHAWISGSTTSGAGQFGSLTLSGSGQFIACYEETGNALLAERLHTATYGLIAVGANDDLYLCGKFYSAVFDMDAGTNTQNRLSNSDMGYLAHYDAAHDLDWIQQIGPHGAAYDACSGIALDASGNVYTTGSYAGSVILCNDTLHAWQSGSSIFISKRDSDGNCIWSRSIGDRSALTGSSSQNLGAAIAVDGDEVYVAGRFVDSVHFGSTQLVSAGNTDLFLAKYDANGNCLWALRGGGPGDDLASTVGVDGNGHVTIAGPYYGTATIGTQTLTSLGYSDGFIARFDANGAPQWTRTMGGAVGDGFADVVVDAAGNSFCTGRFTTSAAFGPITITGTGDADLFVAKYDANGDPEWVTGTTGAGTKDGSSIVQGSNGKLYITGAYAGTADFCTGDLVSTGVDFNAFLACYDAGGDELWVEDFQISGESRGYALAARPGGNIVLTGYLYGSMAIGSTTLTSASYADVILAAFEPDGSPLWAKSMYGEGVWDLSTGNSVVATEDDVYVVGSYGSLLHDGFIQGGSITFETGNPLTTIEAPYAFDAFVVKYASNETSANPADPLGCDGVTLIEEASPVPIDLVIAPNPVDRYFTLTSTTPFDPRARVLVHDALGQEMVAPFNIQGSIIEVEAIALTPGAYTISLFTSAGTLTSRFAKH